ncbi:hypothetical protein SAMN05444581_105126 [Methylocapsa palsarum]|uniref:Uncharacterized protein n=1 Tax=Methylocapsa palsarum TaxID=1612308 RepID=A0A1I3YCD2_9HYPH|nr:hypothetical protein SAMN05444581_105126 [Methylocapsa palsarum]
MDQVISVDRAWFKRNPNRNYRIRAPGEGEVETIMRSSHGDLGYELAAISGGLALPPSTGHSWRILVVSVSKDETLRMLVVRPDGAPDEPPELNFGFAAAIVFNRICIDRLRG